MADNVQRLKHFYSAAVTGDFDAALNALASDIEIRTRLESYAGLEAAERMLREGFADFNAQVDIRAVTEPRPGVVLVEYRLAMRGQETQLNVSQDVFDVAHVGDDGLVHLVEVFSSREDALASIGTPASAKNDGSH